MRYTIERYRFINIALISTLIIGTFLCNEAYCLRAPLQSSSFMQESSPEHKNTVSRRWFIDLVKRIVKVNTSEERQQEAIKEGALVMDRRRFLKFSATLTTAAVVETTPGLNKLAEKIVIPSDELFDLLAYYIKNGIIDNILNIFGSGSLNTSVSLHKLDYLVPDDVIPEEYYEQDLAVYHLVKYAFGMKKYFNLSVLPNMQEIEKIVEFFAVDEEEQQEEHIRRLSENPIIAQLLVGKETTPEYLFNYYRLFASMAQRSVQYYIRLLSYIRDEGLERSSAEILKTLLEKDISSLNLDKWFRLNEEFWKLARSMHHQMKNLDLTQKVNMDKMKSQARNLKKIKKEIEETDLLEEEQSLENIPELIFALKLPLQQLVNVVNNIRLQNINL